MAVPNRFLFIAIRLGNQVHKLNGKGLDVGRADLRFCSTNKYRLLNNLKLLA